LERVCHRAFAVGHTHTHTFYKSFLFFFFKSCLVLLFLSCCYCYCCCCCCCCCCFLLLVCSEYFFQQQQQQQKTHTHTFFFFNVFRATLLCYGSMVERDRAMRSIAENVLGGECMVSLGLFLLVLVFCWFVLCVCAPYPKTKNKATLPFATIHNIYNIESHTLYTEIMVDFVHHKISL
jgi:hypothetical protein